MVLEKAVGFFMKITAAALFVAFLALYVFSFPPALAPYRDAGEMTSCVSTLGVVHPPSYPAYVLAGRAFSSLFPGNLAYRLNLFSAVCGAAGLSALFLILARRFGSWPAVFASALFGLNLTFWHVSSVSEMYSLNILLAVVLLGLAWDIFDAYDKRRFLLLSFFYGLFMGNRLDIVLWGPAVLFLVLAGMKKQERVRPVRDIFHGACFFLLGLSIYLYLPLRALQDPLLDWNHPANWASFWASITRKSYGGTLDLLSKSYSTGELFLPNLKYYAIHIYKNFHVSIILAAVGVWFEIRRRPVMAGAVGLAFLVSGPLFLFLANMPPNPHALAIVEPNYLLPDVCLAVWICSGLAFVLELFAGTARLSGRRRVLIYAAAGSFLLWTAFRNATLSYRRWNLLAVDYASDCMKSTPPGSWLIAKKDVQLFSMWHAQIVEGKRRDLKVLAQGLSGSGWYQSAYQRQHPGAVLRHLKVEKPEQWKSFLAENEGTPVFATFDTEIPKAIQAQPHGNIQKIVGRSDPASPHKFSGPAVPNGRGLWMMYAMRGFGASKDLPDFFSRDLANAYAHALFRSGVALSSRPGMEAEASDKLKSAMTINGAQAEAPLYLGLIASRKKDWQKAHEFFRESADLYEKMIKLTHKYYSLASLKKSVVRASADAYLNLGVSLDKLGRSEEAEKAYVTAIDRNPQSADAHYNLAVIYWNRDWNKVVYELKETLKINPDHPSAAKYLQKINKN